MNISVFMNRIAITIHSVCHFCNKQSSNKNVLIVFQQVFGDSVVIQNSLMEYPKIFPKSEGYTITFIARPSVLNFMKNNLVLPEAINFEEVDFKKFLEDYTYYKDIANKYHNYASIVIVPGTSLSAEVFTNSSNAARKVGLVRYKDVTHPFVYSLFNKLAYTERVRPQKGDMMLQHHRRLLNYLGLSEYRAKLPTPKKQPRVIHGKYAVLCPGASKVEKCWPVERFAKISDYLVENYDLNIHLCGGADERRFEEELISNVKNKNKIISHIGNTTFAEWSSIVQYADLVVGNDSATMHLAAAHRRKAICIAGVYDKFQFFPYKVDELDEGDILPITVYKAMPCEYCRTIGYDAGYGNNKCLRRIQENRCALCIEQITLDDVIDKIKELMG